LVYSSTVALLNAQHAIASSIMAALVSIVICSGVHVV